MKKNLYSGLQFIIIFTLVFLLNSPLVVLYGPFVNIRNTAIGAVATSMHAYLLRYVMSDAEVDRLLAEKDAQSDSSQVISNFTNDHSKDVKLTSIASTRFKGYLLEISDPTRVKVGVAENLGRSGQTASKMAEQIGAVACINAGGFVDPEGTGNGGEPWGLVIRNGSFLYGSKSEEAFPLIGLNDKGVLICGRYTPKQIREMKICEGISFNPVLIVNGQKQITSGDGGWGIAPRSAIGQKADGHILFLVIDGRQPPYSLGATLLDVQNILYEAGAVTAANLDGGSSSIMYYQGRVINRPCGSAGERPIPTAFVVI